LPQADQVHQLLGWPPSPARRDGEGDLNIAEVPNISKRSRHGPFASALQNGACTAGFHDRLDWSMGRQAKRRIERMGWRATTGLSDDSMSASAASSR
jgi:hypothetical protein